MSDSHFVRRQEDIEYEQVDAAAGLRKGVLVGADDGGGNLALRRFTLAPGSEVPKHTNEIEHEQYVLAGEYTVGVSEDGSSGDDDEFTVSAGDAVHIPAGAVHWYRNEGDETGAFICAVPAGDDDIRLVGDAAPE